MSTKKWSVVVTTAPRIKPKLQTTINNLRNAGWDDPTVFSEPESFVSDANTIHNDTRLGVWHNWLQAAKYALDQNPDIVMTVQDDITIHNESKQFAELATERLWKRGDCGYLSLYTPLHYSIIKGNQKPWGIYPIKTYSVWGAMCLVWEPQTLRDVISTHRAQNWIGVKKKIGEEEYEKRKNDSSQIKNLDTALGYIIERDLFKKIYYCNPSCCQHISEDSSIEGRAATGKRAAKFVAGLNCPTPMEIPIN